MTNTTELIEALEFYAAKGGYSTTYTMHSKVQQDRGRRARTALASTQPSGDVSALVEAYEADASTFQKENASLRSQLDEAREALEWENVQKSGFRNAMENAMIAYGMGWDLDGVMEVIRDELKQSEENTDGRARDTMEADQ